MEAEFKVSGNIYYKPISDEYVIISPHTRQGWGVPTRDITPADLRAMADHFEQTRKLADA